MSDVGEVTSKAAFECCRVVQEGITKMLKYLERILRMLRQHQGNLSFDILAMPSEKLLYFQLFMAFNSNELCLLY